jgi:hypothetical protein
MQRIHRALADSHVLLYELSGRVSVNGRQHGFRLMVDGRLYRGDSVRTLLRDFRRRHLNAVIPISCE